MKCFLIIDILFKNVIILKSQEVHYFPLLKLDPVAPMNKCIVYILVGNLMATAVLFPLYVSEKNAKEILNRALNQHTQKMVENNKTLTELLLLMEEEISLSRKK